MSNDTSEASRQVEQLERQVNALKEAADGEYCHVACLLHQLTEVFFSFPVVFVITILCHHSNYS